MNRLSLIALATTAALIALATAPAHATPGAGQGQPGYPHEVAATTPASTLTRSEVRAEAARALAEGRIASGEAAPVAGADGVAQPARTRAQVRAEAVEAVRLGLVASGEASVADASPQGAALQAAPERTDRLFAARQR